MKRNADFTEGDSSILRYIKTLASHQTNAKQQRMDRYIQKVKHGRSDDLIENVKPTELKHQMVLTPSMLKDNEAVPQLSKRNVPKQNAKVDNKSRAPNATKVQGEETDGRKRLHPYEESQFRRRQRKKIKREKEITAIDSFDRFRFKTSSPSKTPQYFAASNGNKVAKSSPRSKHETRKSLQKSEFIGVPSVQQQATNTLPVMSFRVPPQAAAHDSWNSSNQPRFQVPEEIASEAPPCAIPQQTAYEHLVHIMESIFF